MFDVSSGDRLIEPAKTLLTVNVNVATGRVTVVLLTNGAKSVTVFDDSPAFGRFVVSR